jgi:pimeloyl-ACP methyl ester carboxylesterase
VPTAVLVHGAHHGGWCWRRVTDLLQPAGWRVYAPSLTGAGDRAHLLSASVTLQTRIRDITALIEIEELDDVVLCGHSAGGMIITGVADRLPDRISHLVYLDAVVPRDGQSPFDVIDGPEAMPEMSRQRAREHGDGWRLPREFASAAGFGLSAPEDQAWVDRLLTDDSALIMDQRLSLGAGLADIPAKTYVRAARFNVGFNERLFQEFAADPSWTAHSWDVGHEVMIEAPTQVFDLLRGLLPAPSSGNSRRPPQDGSIQTDLVTV